MTCSCFEPEVRCRAAIGWAGFLRECRGEAVNLKCPAAQLCLCMPGNGPGPAVGCGCGSIFQGRRSATNRRLWWVTAGRVWLEIFGWGGTYLLGRGCQKLQDSKTPRLQTATDASHREHQSVQHRTTVANLRGQPLAQGRDDTTQCRIQNPTARRRSGKRSMRSSRRPLLLIINPSEARPSLPHSE